MHPAIHIIQYCPPSRNQIQSRAKYHCRAKRIGRPSQSDDNHGRKQQGAQETLSREASPGPWREEDKTQHRRRSIHRRWSSSLAIFRSNPSSSSYFRGDAGILRGRSRSPSCPCCSVNTPRRRPKGVMSFLWSPAWVCSTFPNHLQQLHHFSWEMPWE